jgi:hypothetical protein
VSGTTVNPNGQSVVTASALVGWESVDDHEAFTGTTAFATAVAGILPYLSGTTSHNDMLVRIPGRGAC